MIERSTPRRPRSAITSLLLALAACGTPTRSLDQLEVVTRVDGGDRIIAMDFGEDVVVLFEDEGAPKLKRSSGEAVAVCPSAADVLVADEGKVAVSCAVLGTDKARVQVFDAELSLENELSPPTQPSGADPAGLNWPIVDRSLSRVRIAEDASDAVFSPDGTLFAIGREDGTVELHATDDPDAAVVTLAPGGEDHGPAVAFSDDSTRVAVASYWGQFRLFSVAGELLASDKGNSDRYGRNGVAFDGERIVQARAGDLVLRDARGKPTEILAATAAERSPFGPGMGGGVGDVAARNGRFAAVDGSGRAAVVFAP